MESNHLVIFSTFGKFITKFNILLCISLSEALFWTGARGRIPITLIIESLTHTFQHVLVKHDLFVNPITYRGGGAFWPGPSDY